MSLYEEDGSPLPKTAEGMPDTLFDSAERWKARAEKAERELDEANELAERRGSDMVRLSDELNAALSATLRHNGVDVATALEMACTDLPPEFRAIVDREFWNLVQGTQAAAPQQNAAVVPQENIPARSSEKSPVESPAAAAPQAEQPVNDDPDVYPTDLKVVMPGEDDRRDATLLSALKLVRAIIKGQPIEYQIVHLNEPDVGLGEWIDRIIDRTGAT